MRAGWLFFCLVAAMGPALAGACGFDRLAEIPSITTTCCDGMADESCASGFPPTCASTCADVLVPFWEACGTLVSSMSAASFPFDIPALGSFASNCRNTRSLLHYSNGVCSQNDGELQARVQDIQVACCVQDGGLVRASHCPSNASAARRRLTTM